MSNTLGSFRVAYIGRGVLQIQREKLFLKHGLTRKPNRRITVRRSFGYIACHVTVVYTDVQEPEINCVKLIKDTALAIYDEPFMLLYISVLRNKSEQWIEDAIKR